MLQLGDLELDLGTLEARRQGQRLILGPNRFEAVTGDDEGRAARAYLQSARNFPVERTAVTGAYLRAMLAPWRPWAE